MFPFGTVVKEKGSNTTRLFLFIFMLGKSDSFYFLYEVKAPQNNTQGKKKFITQRKYVYPFSLDDLQKLVSPSVNCLWGLFPWRLSNHKQTMAFVWGCQSSFQYTPLLQFSLLLKLIPQDWLMLEMCIFNRHFLEASHFVGQGVG